jgi:hypothetical protein
MHVFSRTAKEVDTLIDLVGNHVYDENDNNKKAIL